MGIKKRRGREKERMMSECELVRGEKYRKEKKRKEKKNSRTCTIYIRKDGTKNPSVVLKVCKWTGKRNLMLRAMGRIDTTKEEK